MFTEGPDIAVSCEYHTHLSVLLVVLQVGKLERLNSETSSLSHFPVKPCHLSSLCFSSAVSSPSSSAASPPWSALYLHSVTENFTIRNVKLKMKLKGKKTITKRNTNLCSFNFFFLSRSICEMVAHNIWLHQLITHFISNRQ